MTQERILTELALIGAVGAAAQWLAWRFKLPSILLLLLAGLLVGPATGWVQPDRFLGPLLFPFVSLAVALILFEGGLSLRLEELPAAGKVVTRLVTLGVLATWLLAALGALLFTDLSLRGALVFGSILTVTGPTVIGPLLRHVRPRGVVSAIAKWEGIVIDPVGASLAVLVYEVSRESLHLHSGLSGLWVLALTVVVGGGIGALGALGIVSLMKRHLVPDALQNPFTIGMVLAVYVLSQLLQDEAGLFAVTLMGFMLANAPSIHVRGIIEFKENLRVILISTLFVVLAARLEWGELRQLGLAGVGFVLWLLAVVRPLSVGLATWGSALTRSERLFLAALAPRGIVAAAVASLFALRLQMDGSPDAALFTPLAFLVVLGTVVVSGLSIGPLAQHLGLADSAARGILIVGASPVARMLARALKEDEVETLLVDTNRENVARARLEGLDAVWGDVLDDAVQSRLLLSDLRTLLALTSNDEVNTLACLALRGDFGSDAVWQLAPVQNPKASIRREIGGRELFGPELGFARLFDLARLGGVVKRTKITAEFDLEDFRATYRDEAIPLLKLDRQGVPEPVEATSPLEVSAGEVLYSLVPSKERRPA